MKTKNSKVISWTPNGRRRAARSGNNVQTRRAAPHRAGTRPHTHTHTHTHARLSRSKRNTQKITRLVATAAKAIEATSTDPLPNEADFQWHTQAYYQLLSVTHYNSCVPNVH